MSVNVGTFACLPWCDDPLFAPVDWDAQAWCVVKPIPPAPVLISDFKMENLRLRPIEQVVLHRHKLAYRHSRLVAFGDWAFRYPVVYWADGDSRGFVAWHLFAMVMPLFEFIWARVHHPRHRPRGPREFLHGCPDCHYRVCICQPHSCPACGQTIDEWTT